MEIIDNVILGAGIAGLGASYALYKQYEEQAEQFHNLILCGRLADYRYYNMDQAMKRVLELVKSIK